MPRVRKTESEPEEDAPDGPSRAEIAARVAERVARYQRDFGQDVLLSIDNTMIRNLSAIEVACEQITDRLVDVAMMKSLDVKQLTDSAKTLMAEARLQAKALGIDRVGRTAGEDSDLELRMPVLAKQTRDFLGRRAIVILCMRCRSSEPQITIRQGTIIYHFTDDMEFSWTSRCPGCQEMFTIDHSNYQDFLYYRFDDDAGVERVATLADYTGDESQEVEEE